MQTLLNPAEPNFCSSMPYEAEGERAWLEPRHSSLEIESHLTFKQVRSSSFRFTLLDQLSSWARYPSLVFFNFDSSPGIKSGLLMFRRSCLSQIRILHQVYFVSHEMRWGCPGLVVILPLPSGVQANLPGHVRGIYEQWVGPRGNLEFISLDGR